MEGIRANVRLATPGAWVAARRLQPGDLIWTQEAGAVPVVRASLWREAAWQMVVPPGAMGNAEEVALMPGQPVRVLSDWAAAVHGAPFVLLPALALEGWHGIARRLTGAAIVRLVFDRAVTVFAGRGMLLGCAGLTPAAAGTMPALSLREGRELVARMVAGEAADALRLMDQAAFAGAKRL